MTEIDVLPTPGLDTETTKGWRNYFRARATWWRASGNVVVHPGDIFPGDKVWPSKDVAETKARQYLDDVFVTRPGVPPSSLVGHRIGDHCDYLGCMPEEMK